MSRQQLHEDATRDGEDRPSLEPHGTETVLRANVPGYGLGALLMSIAERGLSGQLSLVSDVATGYLQLVELDQEHDIATRTLASRRQTLDLARQRFQRGVISELDVRQFEAQIAVAAVRLSQVERARSQQEHALNVLLGEVTVTVPRGGSLAEAAKALGVTSRTLWRHVNAGSMPALRAFRVPGLKAWRVPVVAIRELLAERRSA